MLRRYEYHKLMNEMYTVYVESNLASPLSGSLSLEIKGDDTVRKVVHDFLDSLENEDGIPGLAVFDKYFKKLDWDATIESQGITEGAKLFIAYEKVSQFRPAHIAVIGISVLIIAAVLFVTTSVLYSTTGGDIPFDFGIVIDAGSTHSEIFLYQWEGSKFHGTGEVYQRNFCRIEGGIADGSDPGGLVSCVKNVSLSLPNDITSTVNLYLGATAGMRLLNMSNPLETHLILTAVKYALEVAPAKIESIKIISGQDEGVFSWITSNFLSKTLNVNEVNMTYGALDLGGASTQIAFATKFQNTSESFNTDLLKLYGHKFPVVSRSFLCFGLQQASNRIESIILMDEMNDTVIDPCLPKDFAMKLQLNKLSEHPCTANENISHWMHQHSDLEKITVSGSSDFEGCKEVVKKLVNPKTCKEMNFQQCLEVVDVSVENTKFLAFSSFYYIVNYLSPNSSLEKFEKAAKNFCKLTYDEIKHQAHSESDLSHLIKYCFGAVYVIELFTAIYGFNSSTWRNIEFVQSIKDTDVGWSLGFMINATNAIPEELPRPPLVTLAAYVPLAVLSVLMIIFAILLFQRHYKSIFPYKNADSLLHNVA